MNDELEKINALPKDQQLPYAIRRHKELGEELKDLEWRKGLTQIQIESTQSLLDWWEHLPPLRLEKNEHSRLHKLYDAVLNKRFLMADNDTTVVHEALKSILNTFVVKHDWARAFENVEIDGDESELKFHLPYPVCSFEFIAAGRPVIVLMREATDGTETMLFIEGPHDHWAKMSVPEPTDSGDMHNQWKDFVDFFSAEIWSICVALDAEVATHSVVRAPAKLNAKRLEKGRTPLYDYHVVDLARRHRISNPRPGAGAGSKKRLHFRRGHWRHYETHTTWVRWCLVGDPDLGFIDKHYSL